MAWAKLILLCVIVEVNFQEGTGAAVEMTCPSTFVSGKSHSITCSINTNDISNAGCLSTPTSVVFDITHADGSDSTLCVATYPGASNCVSGSVTADNTCNCTGVNGNIETYTFKYVGRYADKGTRLGCKVCAAAPPIVIPESNCDSLVFVDPCANYTCGPGTCQLSSSASPECDCSGTGYSGSRCEDKNSACQIACIVGIVVGVTLAIVVIITIILILYKNKKICS